MTIISKLGILRPLASLALGIWLAVLGAQMAHATFVTKKTMNVPGTKVRNAAIGASGGAVLGGGAAAAVGGGIGIAAVGTGVGIPLVVLILIGLGLGAGAGGLAGAASGTSASTAVVISAPAALYSPWMWGAVLVGGGLFILYSISHSMKPRQAL